MPYERPVPRGRAAGRVAAGFRRGVLALLAVAAAALGPTAAVYAFSVQLTSALPSPQAVGTSVELQAVIQGTAGTEDLRYRFEYSEDGQDWSMLADYGTLDTFPWHHLDEGSFVLRVTATDRNTADTEQAILQYDLTSLGSVPTVVPTAHPLVALVGIPTCATGFRVRVRFWPAQESPPGTSTPFYFCDGQSSVNILVAGMRADTEYTLLPEYSNGRQAGRLPPLAFTTGPEPADILLDFQVTDPVDAATSTSDGVVLVGYTIRGGRTIIATDLEGRLIWYNNNSRNTGFSLTRPVPGGTLLMLSYRDEVKGQVVQEMDLTGHVVRETTNERISDQLESMGHNRVTSIHHEALRLDDGRTVVLGSEERILTDVQGPGDVNVLGDVIIELDENFQVTWVWNAFDHLDPAELAILGEICESAGPGCPPFYATPEANDWTHANALGYSPADGNLVISVRHLDAVFKLDYADGTGSGEVVWRLGNDGDFGLIHPPGIAWPWFSHQHDSHYERGGTLVLFDNGNVRNETLGATENSRGQVYLLDETAKVAYLVGNYDLGKYSRAVGSGHLLSNGNHQFANGFINNSEFELVEVTPAGDVTWSMSGPDLVYRSFRMYSLYWGGFAPLGALGGGGR